MVLQDTNAATLRAQKKDMIWISKGPLPLLNKVEGSDTVFCYFLKSEANNAG